MQWASEIFSILKMSRRAGFLEEPCMTTQKQHRNPILIDLFVAIRLIDGSSISLQLRGGSPWVGLPCPCIVVRLLTHIRVVRIRGDSDFL